MEWKNFLPGIMPELPGVPAPVAFGKLRDAARHFCKKTWMWQIEQEAHISQGQDSVELIPDEGDVVAIVSVISGGSPLCETAFGYNKTTGSVTLAVPAAGDMDINVTLAIMPKMNAAECPDWMAGYKEAIEAYAKALLASMRGREWFMPEQAASFFYEFERLSAQARIENEKQNTRRNAKVRMRRFV